MSLQQSKSKLIVSKLYNAFKAAFPLKPGVIVQQEANTYWEHVKNKPNVKCLVEKKICNLRTKTRGTINHLFQKTPTSSIASTSATQITIVNEQTSSSRSSGSSLVNEIVKNSGNLENSSIQASNLRAFKQVKINEELDLINSDLSSLCKRKFKSQLSKQQEDEVHEKKKVVLEKDLKALKTNLLHQSSLHKRKRELNERIAIEHPKYSNLQRKSAGRPCLEEDQPELAKTLLEIASYGAAAHEKRQMDVFHSITSLPKLQEALESHGLQISKSGLYLRLLPRNSSSIEGKKHKYTVPVKLIRCANDEHKRHPDSLFAKTSINHLEEIASMLGPEQVIFLSADDKARVKLEVTAALHQGPILMNMNHRIKLQCICTR